MTTEKHPFGTIARLKTEKGWSVGLRIPTIGGNGLWAVKDGFVWQDSMVTEVQPLLVLDPKMLDFAAVYKRLHGITSSLRKLEPYVRGAPYSESIVSDVWDAVHDIYDDLKSVPQWLKFKEPIPEPKNFGAVVLVQYPGKDPMPYQLSYEGAWVFGESKRPWSAIEEYVTEVVFDGVKV